MLKSLLSKVFSLKRQRETAALLNPDPFSSAKAAFEQRNYEEAARLYLLDIEEHGNSPETLCGLGAAEAMLNNHAGAEQRFSDALQMAPNHVNARLGLANIKLLTKQHEESVRLYSALAKEFPEVASIQKSYQKALAEGARYADLEPFYLDHLSRVPNDAEGWTALSVLYLNLNRLEDAEAAIVSGLACAPLDPMLAFNRSHIHLRRGDLRTGWALYENRFSLAKKYFQPAEPKWDGSVSHVKKIVLYEEQGYGDLLMFIRFVPRLQAMFETVELVCRPDLHDLMRASFDISLRVPESRSLVTADLGCFLLSLPHALGLKELADLQMRSPYIKPSDSAVAEFGFIRGERAKARIGLVWGGAPARSDDISRTLSSDDILELIDLPDVSWFLLQKGRETPPEVRQRSFNVADQIRNFNDLAGAMSNLDAIISVDTAAAHLAGAMGKETFLLEPFANDWRWRIGETQSPWYPSVRLFKAQNDPRNRWGVAISNLKQALATRFQLRSES